MFKIELNLTDIQARKLLAILNLSNDSDIVGILDQLDNAIPKEEDSEARLEANKEAVRESFRKKQEEYRDR